MATVNNNTPTLRFPEFKGNWKKKKFNEIFIFSTGKSIKQNEASPEFETPCVRYGELYHMYDEVITEVINKTNLNKSELTFSQGNEILLPSAGEDPMDIGSASALTIKNVAIGRTINVLRPLITNVYSQIYVAYHINHKLKKDISKLAKGVSISNVYNSDLKTLEITLPTLQEQTKISTFLTTVDEKLQALKQKKSILEQYKKGVMQKIFSQELRFKDDNGNTFADWEEKMLGDVCKTTKSGGTPISTKREYYNGDIPFLSISDMTSQGKYLNYTSNHISKLGLDNSASWVVPAHSIIYSMYASIGFVAINNIPLATSQAVLNLILKEGINTDFIYYTLVDFQKKITQFVTTGTQGNLNAQSVRGFKIQIPSLKEQTKIATFLSTIDEKINQCQAQITNTEVWKRGLLQGMFI
ncbi:restriction endonuclease subunit S [Flavobacterium sp. LB3R33]|uniref:restriction endonuclease subunit S n=1 Tax=Flavobacterium sp. LB3R33 TaxID=3401721 RepID=UPI003AAE20C1